MPHPISAPVTWRARGAAARLWEFGPFLPFRGTPYQKRAPWPAGARLHGLGRQSPTDSGALRNVSAVCGSVCSSATLHAPPVHVRASAQRLRTPSWRHGYRHSNTTCVQGCARTPPRPARCCPDALTPPVRANGRLPRALAPLHRPPVRTESSLFFWLSFFRRAGGSRRSRRGDRAEFGFGRGVMRGGAGGAHRNAPARTPNSPDGRAPRSGICHVSVRRIPQ